MLDVLCTVLFERGAGSTEYFHSQKTSLLLFEYFLNIKLKLTQAGKKWQVIIHLTYVNNFCSAFSCLSGDFFPEWITAICTCRSIHGTSFFPRSSGAAIASVTIPDYTGYKFLMLTKSTTKLFSVVKLFMPEA